MFKSRFESVASGRSFGFEMTDTDADELQVKSETLALASTM